MNKFLYAYLSGWIILCLSAIIVYLKDKNSYSLSKSTYRRFLLTPWKIITFLIAAIGFTVIAPYTGDPTWDYYDTMFMSILTYFTAPWAMGALYKAAKKELPVKQAFVAICLWMFSASWSYDIYILIRDGHYPVTWFANIFASSLLYVSAGLLWSLDWRKNKGVIFAFMENDWPVPSTGWGFSKIIWFALPFIILVSFLIIYFFLWKA